MSPYRDMQIRAAYKLAHARLPKQRKQQRRYRDKHSERNQGDYPPKRTSHLKRRYGITDAQYCEMLEEQGGRCAVCRTSSPGNGVGDRFFDVDHDHATGAVRGLLCRKCNVTLGVLEKNRILLGMLEIYLAKGDPR